MTNINNDNNDDNNNIQEEPTIEEIKEIANKVRQRKTIKKEKGEVRKMKEKIIKPKKDEIKEEVVMNSNIPITDITPITAATPITMNDNNNNNFDELFLKLMNINDTINNVKEDIDIIKSNIKTKKPRPRPKKVIKEGKTLDLTITDKEINNIINNKNDVFTNLLNELKK